MLQLIGALIRALILGIVIAAPSYILPDIPNVTRELSLIIGGIVAAFVLFEYSSKTPGFVDFRFAPPYNRLRIAVLAALAIGLSILFRSEMAGDPTLVEWAEWTIPLTVTPNSPVDFVVNKVALFETATSLEVLTRTFSAAFFVSAALSVLFSLLLWVFKWPFGRTKFNLWANLPTFSPAEVSLTGRRLRRDGWLNIILSLGLYYIIPFAFPIMQTRLGPDLFGDTHSLIWIATAWGFLPSLLFIRGISIIKVSRILARAIASK